MPAAYTNAPTPAYRATASVTPVVQAIQRAVLPDEPVDVFTALAYHNRFTLNRSPVTALTHALDPLHPVHPTKGASEPTLSMQPETSTNAATPGPAKRKDRVDCSGDSGLNGAGGCRNGGVRVEDRHSGNGTWLVEGSQAHDGFSGQTKAVCNVRELVPPC